MQLTQKCTFNAALTRFMIKNIRFSRGRSGYFSENPCLPGYNLFRKTKKEVPSELLFIFIYIGITVFYFPQSSFAKASICPTLSEERAEMIFTEFSA